MRGVLSALSAVMLAACGPIQHAQLDAQQADAREQQQQWNGRLRTFAAQQQQTCDDRVRVAEFNSIRGKIELCKVGEERIRTTPTTFLAIDTYPSAIEKKAVARWLSLHDELQLRSVEWINSNPLPGVSADVWRRLTSFYWNLAELNNELAAGLYQDKITYGEFAKRRQQNFNNETTAVQDYIAAQREADYQRRLAAQALAEQRYRTEVQEQQNWLRAMKIVADMLPQHSSGSGGFDSNGRVICTNNPMASGTIPNPTICQNF